VTKFQRHKVGLEKSSPPLFLFSWTLSLCAFVPLCLSSSFDFGSASSASIICHDFIVTNSASVPLEIGKVRPSCDCLQILSWPRVIPPNAEGAISVRLMPDKLGPVEYKIFVESSSGSNLTLILNDIRGIILPAARGNASHKNSLAGISPGLFTRAVVERDESCYISAPDILAVQKRKSEIENPASQIRSRESGTVNFEPFIIDVRSPDSFDSVHIPGALNIPLCFVRTKSFLRSKRIVLVDGFGGDPELEKFCRGLRSDDFASVAILRGGLNAWRLAGGALEGAAVKNVSLMSPSDYAKVRDFSDWRVVYSGSSEGFARASAFIAEIESAPLKIANRKSAIENILVVTDEGGNYNDLTSDFTGRDANVFCLSGGLAAYENYLRQASLKPGKRIISSASGREAAAGSPKPAAARGQIRRKPCGSCS